MRYTFVMPVPVGEVWTAEAVAGLVGKEVAVNQPDVHGLVGTVAEAEWNDARHGVILDVDVPDA